LEDISRGDFVMIDWASYLDVVIKEQYQKNKRCDFSVSVKHRYQKNNTRKYQKNKKCDL
jgi:hypothetical protein